MKSRREKDMLSNMSLHRPEGTVRSRYEEVVLKKQDLLPTLSLKSIDEENFNINALLEDGSFEEPLRIVNSKSGDQRGIQLPVNMSIAEVSRAIGENTDVKIIDVDAQTEVVGYSLGDYANYLAHRTPQHKVLNLISLEVSGTPLAAQIQSPEVVRQIDWIDSIWPLSRRSRGDYPRVQKYCLIGMEGAYTDFHVDFGGTSVWYQVCWGAKRFFMVPPSEDNLRIFSDWLCSPDQDSTFFGDLVGAGNCLQVDLLPGATLFIPSGWIHAVYTPKDSLVFGGNFLHSLSIVKQLQVYVLEQRTHVAKAYRFPLFRQLHMYALCEHLRMLRSFLETGAAVEEDTDGVLTTLLTSSQVLQQMPHLVRMCSLWSQSQEAAERVAFEEAAATAGLGIEAVFAQWWALLRRLATERQDAELAGIIDTVQHADSLDLLSLADGMTAPPPPDAPAGKTGVKLVLKRRAAPVLKLKLKSRKLAERTTTQSTESTGHYSTRGLKLTSSFLMRSATEPEDEDEYVDEDYDEMDEEEDEGYEEETAEGVSAGSRGGGGKEAKVPVVGKVPVSSSVNRAGGNTVRQNILKKLGMKKLK